MLRRSSILLFLFFVLLGFVSQISVSYAHDNQATAVSPMVINEILVSNASVNLDTDTYQFSDWIELYNPGPSAVNLGGYFLSDDLALPFKYQIPANTWVTAGSHILFWADDLGYGRHTNFKLNHNGETVVLHDNFWTFVDSITYDPQLPDISYGRQGDGNPTWVYFGEPTPQTSNATPGFLDQTRAPNPEFSLTGGFYVGSQSVDLSTPSLTADIRYTLDGSIPTTSSTLFQSSIPISATAVLRARVFDDGVLPGTTATQTYFIDVTSTLPVVSVVTDPDNLWDDTIGIYTAGTNGIPGNCSNDPVNWNQDWERPSNVAMYAQDNSVTFQLDAGIEIFGGCTRIFDRKSLALRFRDKYGIDRVDQMLFDDKPVNSFRSLVLRNSGNDARTTSFRDAMMQSLVKDQMDIDYQAYRPAIVFINGQYWGYHAIREKLNDDYLASNHGVDPNNIDLIEDENEVKNGDLVHYQALLNYISTHDMSTVAAYTYVLSQMDVDEFMNYQIAEIYFRNTDWPGSNLKYWRPRTPDGRWRWILFDTDFGFGLNGGPTAYTFDSLSFATATNGPGWPNPPWSTFLLRSLLQNSTFEAEFMQRFASHINISFEPGRVNGIIDAMQAVLAPEIQAHIDRWSYPASVTVWNANVDVLREFGNQRPSYMRTHIDNYFGNPGTADLTVNIIGGGDVYVSSVKVPASGYTGPYFKNVPMQLKAVPALGYTFVEWQETAVTNPQTSLTINTATTITAVFEAVPLPNLVINELHYHPSSILQGDDTVYEFLEIYNAGDTAVALDNFSISNGVEFTFPTSTSIAPDEYIVVSINSATYSGNGYQVFQWTSGKLNNAGETVALSNDLGQVLDEVLYDDAPPWVISPDGNGPSLSLINPTWDNSLAINWTASDVTGGTPGQINTVFCPTDATNVLSVASADPDGELSWVDSDPASSRSYEIWHSDTAVYFQPEDIDTSSLPAVVNSPYLHTNALADAANHYYRMRSINRCQQPAAASNLVGIFKYDIEPGQ